MKDIIKLKNNGRSPIMLIDDAMAHLDLAHKEYLFNELSNLESQVWLSGVSKELFNNINYQTVYFDMKNIVYRKAECYYQKNYIKFESFKHS